MDGWMDGYFIKHRVHKANGSINAKPAHPPPGICRAFFFLLLLAHGGVIAREGQPGGGALSKTTLTLKKSIWFHSNMSKYLHNCSQIRTRDDKKKNVHGT